MNEVVEKEIVDDLIYEVRGVQVMLDSDLARLYECKNGTKEINQAVKNNPEKFPNRYCFKITDEEFRELRSKHLTTKFNNMSRTTPRVFTEQGIYMLATILKGSRATHMTLLIMDTFVMMKKYISNDLINNKVLINHEERILKLEESFAKLSNKQISVIYDGKIYDAYSILLDIFNEAKEEIIIVDNYVNKELLDILRMVERKIIILSKNINNELAKKYKMQYANATFISKNPFHDRYIILDKKKVYISGMSLKDIGKKYSYINKVQEEIFINELLKRISDMI